MYSHYVLLKSIRNDIEWGSCTSRRRQGARRGSARKSKDIPDLEQPGEGADAGEEDLEQQFHYHLRGLHTVLSKLTRQSQHPH